MVRFTEPAGIVPELGRREAERLRQHYIGPEHLLPGLLVEARGRTLEALRAAVRGELDRGR